MSRAAQLPLQMSLADAVTLQQERDRAYAYARAEHEHAEALEEECRKLRDALKAAHATNTNLGLQLATVSMDALRMIRELGRRNQAHTPSPTLDTDTLLHLVKLCHPDRWHGQPAETLAHELTVTINKLREGDGYDRSRHRP